MSVVVSCQYQWNLDTLLERIWAEMEMVRVYTKRRGELPSFADPLVLTPQRGNSVDSGFCRLSAAVSVLRPMALIERAANGKDDVVLCQCP